MRRHWVINDVHGDRDEPLEESVYGKATHCIITSVKMSRLSLLRHAGGGFNRGCDSELSLRGCGCESLVERRREGLNERLRSECRRVRWLWVEIGKEV